MFTAESAGTALPLAAFAAARNTNEFMAAAAETDDDDDDADGSESIESSLLCSPKNFAAQLRRWRQRDREGKGREHSRFVGVSDTSVGQSASQSQRGECT